MGGLRQQEGSNMGAGRESHVRLVQCGDFLPDACATLHAQGRMKRRKLTYGAEKRPTKSSKNTTRPLVDVRRPLTRARRRCEGRNEVASQLELKGPVRSVRARTHHIPKLRVRRQRRSGRPLLDHGKMRLKRSTPAKRRGAAN